MLVTLPVNEPIVRKKKLRFIPLWLPVGVAILFLLVGLGLGFASNSLFAKEKTNDLEPSADIASSISIYETKSEKSTVPMVADLSPEVVKPHPKSCGGFNYTVRRGDSLSLIATRFYGDSNFWSFVSQANPDIKGRENLIEIDELLLIPNLPSTCLNS